MIVVVPCKYDPAHPVIFECVDSIRAHHPEARIVVVDSASDDRSYLDALGDVKVADIENRGYCTGAYRWAFEHYPDDDYYALIHDSLILHDRVRFDAPFTASRHFVDPPTSWGYDAHGRPLSEWAAQHVDFDLPASYTGIQGPILFAHRHVVTDLYDAGFFHIPVTDGFQNCAMERLAGIYLERLGYDPTNSLQGEMHGFWDAYDESVVEKRSYARC